MADDKNEEEYLDKLLKNAMVTDEILDNDTTDTKDMTEKPDELTDNSADEALNESAATVENFSTMKEPEETQTEDIVGNLKDIVDGVSENTDNEDVPDDAEKTQESDIVALDDSADASDILALDDSGLGDEEPVTETPGDISSQENVNEVTSEPVTGDANTADATASPDNVTESGNEPAEDNKKKKKKDKKSKKDRNKDKTAGKKFSLKNFFLEEEDEGDDKAEGDENQKLIDELYADKDSLSDERPEDIGKEDKKSGKEKKQKEKKSKEKKPKEKKEKKPKPPRPPKKPKEPGEKLPVAAIARTVLIASVLAAAIIIGCKIFSYRNSVSSAKEYFETGNYSKAYDTLAGLTIKDNDMEFYQKVETVMMVAQGLESYESNMAVGNTAGAIDALIQAVGRKARFEDRITQYGVEQQVQKVYGRVTGLLSEYGISEEQALDYYSMTSHDKYYDILKGYGGVPDDSGD